MNFVHLHVHSSYSLDSVIRIPDLCERVANLGMPAVALTDHGVLCGAIEFHDEAAKAGIKPIIGCEIRVSSQCSPDREDDSSDNGRHHLVLLVEKEEGYRNLVRIVSARRFGEFPGELVVGKEFLRRNAKGLIATSGCARGEIPDLLRTGGEDIAERALEEYREIFDGGRFYLEIQDAGGSGQSRLNEMLIRLARRTGTPLVATNDCRHIDRGDARELGILRMMRAGKTISDSGVARMLSRREYVRSDGEMERAFGHVVPDALENTLTIAERCTFNFMPVKPALPEVPCPGGVPPDEHLRRLASDALSMRLREMGRRGEAFPPGEDGDYGKRLARELDAIKSSGTSNYFLVLEDYVRYARDRGIPVGPGRGSAPGSLVAYALGLTDIDPIRYGLHFERFLNPLRGGVPDIEIDLCAQRRDEVVRHLVEKYGPANVAGVSVFGTMSGTGAIRDVGRVLEIPGADVGRLAKSFPFWQGSIEDAMARAPEFREAASETPEMRALVARAERLEGIVRTVGRHASAVAISDRPIAEKVPVFDTGNGLVTQFSSQGIEKVGVVRFNLLRFRILTVMRDSACRILERKGVQVDIDNIPLDDAPTYEMISRGDTSGVHEANSKGFKEMLIRMHPDTFGRIVDVITLYRPGPLQYGLTDRYLLRRSRRGGPSRVAVPEVEEILGDTYGVILYQEQIMDLAARLAGYPMEEADLLRVWVRTQKPADFEKHRGKFIAGGIRNGHPRERIEGVFRQNLEEGKHAFNKSHAVGYGLLLYRTAYLKCHWPEEYSAAIAAAGGDD